MKFAPYLFKANTKGSKGVDRVGLNWWGALNLVAGHIMRVVCSHNDDLVAEEVSWHVLQWQFLSSPSLWHKLVELDSVAG